MLSISEAGFNASLVPARVTALLVAAAQNSSIKNLTDLMTAGAGMVRTNCSLVAHWNGYACRRGTHAPAYRPLAVESLINSTATSIGPLAVLSNGYFDMLSGPMDRSICTTANCPSNREATFFPIVQIGLNYSVVFGTASPYKMRLSMPQARVGEGVRVGMIFKNPRSQEVYLSNGTYCMPKNANVSVSGSVQYAANASLEVAPGMSACSNYFDQTVNLLQISVCGNQPVFVVALPSAVVSIILKVTAGQLVDTNLLTVKIANALHITADQIVVASATYSASTINDRVRQEELVPMLHSTDPMQLPRRARRTSSVAFTFEIQFVAQAPGSSGAYAIDISGTGSLASASPTTPTPVRAMATTSPTPTPTTIPISEQQAVC